MNIRSLCIIVITLISLAFPVKSQGAVVRINYDAKTIAALEAALATELAQEAGIYGDIKQISKHYTEASVALSGIYLLKKNDRKALEQERMFAQQEFYYYKLCCRYASLIIMKVVNITKLLAERPEAILQWGPFIYDVVTKTKEHCQQFSAIVTNGKKKVTLEDAAKEIGWLTFGDEMIELMTLQRLADIPWRTMIDDFSGDFDKLSKDISIKDIGDALKSLYDKGSSLANAPLAVAGQDILDELIGPIEDVVSPDINNNESNNSNNGESTNPNQQKKKKLEKTKSTVKKIKAAVDSVMHVYDIIKDPNNIKAMFLEKLGLSEPLDPNEVIKKIFKSEGNDLDISSYVNDYNTPDSMMTYQQMWHIVRKIHNSEVVCDYSPGYSDSEWYFLRNPVQSISSITNTDKELALQMSEREAGWSRSTCETYTNQTRGQQTYQFNSEIKWIYDGSWQTSNIKAIAYKIKVIRETNINEKKYSAQYFSDKQDEKLFELDMKKLLYEYQENDQTPGVTYEIRKDPPVYTEKPDTAKLKNSASVSFIVKCSDGGEISSGSFSWKVNPSFRYGDLNSTDAQKRAIELAMETSLDPSDLNTNEVDAAIKAVEDSIADYEKKKIELENEKNKVNEEINNAINQGYTESLKQLNEKMGNINNEIASIDYELSVLNSHLEEYKEGRVELLNDYYDQETADRIPSKEIDLAQLFKLNWVNNVGNWNGLSYTHAATTGNEAEGYQWTFNAKLSLNRKEKRILGIRIHRAILQVDWALNGNIESENVASVLLIDSTWSASQREAKVKNQLDEVRRLYPDCSVSLQYEKIDNIQEDDKDVIHLLWPHERLELARDLSSRLINIYSRLIGVERYIHYTQTIKEWIKGKLKYPMRPPERGNKADSCLREWIRRAEDYTTDNNNILL